MKSYYLLNMIYNNQQQKKTILKFSAMKRFLPETLEKPFSV